MHTARIYALVSTVLLALLTCAAARSAPPLYAPGRTFNLTDHIVSTSVFHWYTSDDGQLSGPWLPIEGRANWTGEAIWWQGQIKQMMMANIDVLWVHLFPGLEQQRVNLFLALNQLRAQGYDVPKVAPFLDPMITWDGTSINVADASGKDAFVEQYRRWFQQYYSVNLDSHADSYIQQIGGKVVLDTWHVKYHLMNLSSLTRSDVETRLAAQFGAAHPIFNNGIRMVTTAINPPTLSFADEKVAQFEVHAYGYPTTFNGVSATQLKPGYWDQNIRTPGYCLKRNGAAYYRTAWNNVNRSTTSRVYIESWNEYDEGSGIYAAVTSPPYILPGSGNPSSDTWSSANDPYEYIRATASGAAAFNDYPALDAKHLWNDIPTQVRRSTTYPAKLIIRNAGDVSWNNASGVRFGQDRAADPAVFCASDYTIDDGTNEIPTYGGIFRGRPIEFSLQLTSPSTEGTYVTHWGMADSTGQRFGEQVPVTIQVTGAPVPTPARPTDPGATTRYYQIRFNWTAVTDPAGIAGYNLHIGTSPGASDAMNLFVGNVLTRTINATDGKTYYCTVQAVANDGATSQWSAPSDGITYDATAPTAPGTPADAGLYTANPSITFTWTPSTDSASGVVDYICRIGTAPGSHNVFNGSVGNVLSKTITVAPRKTYYCRVVGKDAAGNAANWSANSDGIGVVDFADEPLSLTKSHPDATWIGLTLPVSAAFENLAYVHDAGALSGIAVLFPGLTQTVGIMGAYGPLATTNGERAISAVATRPL